MLFLVLAVALVVAAVLYAKKPGPKWTQDVVGKTEITQDGLIKSGNVYRIVIEVEPKNLDTASETERISVWQAFFSLINTLNTPYTLLVQSRIFEAKDYINDLEKSVDALAADGLKESGRQVIAYLRQMEETHIRDNSGYIILCYNPAEAQSGRVSTGMTKLDSVINKGTQTSRMTEKEKMELAEQMLSDAAELVYGFCEQTGMRCERLNRVGVLNVTYQTLQRDMAPHARMIDALEADAFRPVKRSLSMEVVQDGA